jgi:hypothetical protein
MNKNIGEKKKPKISTNELTGKRTKIRMPEKSNQ